MNPQHIILFHYFGQILKRAADEQIDIIPLKGAHLLTTVYGDENRGPMADVDFMVRDSDWQKTIILMEQLEFTQRELPFTEIDTHEIGFNMALGGDKKILIELHRFLFNPERFYIDHDALWGRAYKSTFDNISRMRMADEDIFCHIAFHGAIHRLMQMKRALRDLELLLKHTDLSPLLIAERAKEWECTRAVWFFLELLKDKIDKPGLSEAISSIKPPYHIRIALLALVKDGEQTRITSLHHRSQAAIIWPLMFDTKKQLIKMLAHHPVSPLKTGI